MSIKAALQTASSSRSTGSPMSTSSTPPTLAGGAAVGSLSAASTPPRGTAEAGFGVASLAAARTVTHDDDDDVFYPTSTGSSSATTSLQAARAPQSPVTASRAHTLRSAPAAASAPSCASMTPELALQRIDKLQADHTALEKALHVCSEQCGRAFDRLASVAGVVIVEALQGVITAPANNGDGAGDGVSIGSSAASKHAMNGARVHSGTVDGSSHLLLPYLRHMLRALRHPSYGLSVRDRRWRLRVYPACFIGSQLVDWLLDTVNARPHILPAPLPRDRQECVLIGRALLDRGVLYHVTKEHHFKDDMLFYRFRESPVPCLLRQSALPLDVSLPGSNAGSAARAAPVVDAAASIAGTASFHSLPAGRIWCFDGAAKQFSVVLTAHLARCIETSLNPEERLRYIEQLRHSVLYLSLPVAAVVNLAGSSSSMLSAGSTAGASQSSDWMLIGPSSRDSKAGTLRSSVNGASTTGVGESSSNQTPSQTGRKSVMTPQGQRAQQQNGRSLSVSTSTSSLTLSPAGAAGGRDKDKDRDSFTATPGSAAASDRHSGSAALPTIGSPAVALSPAARERRDSHSLSGETSDPMSGSGSMPTATSSSVITGSGAAAAAALLLRCGRAWQFMHSRRGVDTFVMDKVFVRPAGSGTTGGSSPAAGGMVATNASASAAGGPSTISSVVTDTNTPRRNVAAAGTAKATASSVGMPSSLSRLASQLHTGQPGGGAAANAPDADNSSDESDSEHDHARDRFYHSRVIKTVGVIPVSPDQFVREWRDLSTRRKWAPLFSSATVLSVLSADRSYSDHHPRAPTPSAVTESPRLFADLNSSTQASRQANADEKSDSDSPPSDRTRILHCTSTLPLRALWPRDTCVFEDYFTVGERTEAPESISEVIVDDASPPLRFFRDRERNKRVAQQQQQQHVHRVLITLDRMGLNASSDGTADAGSLQPIAAGNASPAVTGLRVDQSIARDPAGVIASAAGMGTTHVIYEISVEHRHAPLAPGVVRAEVLLVARIVRPVPGDPNKAELTMITQLDFRGDVPDWLLDRWLGQQTIDGFGNGLNTSLNFAPLSLGGVAIARLHTSLAAQARAPPDAFAVVPRDRFMLPAATPLSPVAATVLVLPSPQGSRPHSTSTPSGHPDGTADGTVEQLQHRALSPASSRKTVTSSFLPTGISVDTNGAMYAAVGLRDFDTLVVLGRGARSKITQVRYKQNGHLFAMKVLKKRDVIATKQTENLLRERKLLTELRHPFLLRMHASFQSVDQLYFVLDYAPGGDMFTLLTRKGRFTERVAQLYVAELVCVLRFLHSKGVAHRDLKPENILIDEDGHVILADLGLCKDGLSTYSCLSSSSSTSAAQAAAPSASPVSATKSASGGSVPPDQKSLDASRSFTMVGTSEYIAPEMLLGHGHGIAIDWWQLGVIIHEMLCGKHPFEQPLNSAGTGPDIASLGPAAAVTPSQYSNAHVYRLHQRIVKCEPLIHPALSPAAQSLIRGLLSKDPARRLGMTSQRLTTPGLVSADSAAAAGTASTPSTAVAASASSLEVVGDLETHPFFAGVDWWAVYEKRVMPEHKPAVLYPGDVSNFDEDFTREVIDFGSSPQSVSGLSMLSS